MEVSIIMPADDTSGFYDTELEKMNQLIAEVNRMLSQDDLVANILSSGRYHNLRIQIANCSDFNLIKTLANPDETGIRKYHNRLQAYCKLVSPYPGKTIEYHFIPVFTFSKINCPPYKEDDMINCIVAVYLSDYHYDRDANILYYTLTLYLSAIERVR